MKQAFTAVFQLIIECFLFFTYPIIGLVNSVFEKSSQQPKEVFNGKTIVIVERWIYHNVFHLFWKRYLESFGFKVYLLSYSLKKGTFSQSARELKYFLEQHDLNNVTLVGISSGGITALLYLQDYQGWDRVQQFISIGTPFKGTIAALPVSFFLHRRDLLPWSRLSNKMKTIQIVNPKKIICMVAKFDELVPRSSATLPNTMTDIVPSYGHNYLHLVCKETYTKIANYAK